MIPQVKKEAGAAGISITAADEHELVFAPLGGDSGNEVRFVQDTVILSFAVDFAAYGFDSEQNN